MANIENTTSESSVHNCSKEKNDDEDIISSLPDDVLCRILSLIPTKYALGTSILSKQWKHLLMSVPNLDLDDSMRFYCRRDSPCLEYKYLANISNFNNLTYLRLEVVHPNWKNLPHVLEYSPNLVTFVFRKAYRHHELQDRKCEWHEPSSRTRCLLSSLEDIRFTGFENCCAEMDMLRFFVRSAMVLKSISIQSYYNEYETLSRFCDRVMMCRKSSTQLDFQFCLI